MGTHKELLERGRVYSSLYHLQFGRQKTDHAGKA
jgi:ABC-type multidrug transport system fused ATPase/permease subunit